MKEILDQRLLSFHLQKRMSDSPLAAVCTVSLLALLLVCFVPFGHALGSNGRLRSRLIPRYIAEKEIRGPTYHVIHNMRLDEDMENYRRDSVRKGPSYVQRQRQKLKGRQDTSEWDLVCFAITFWERVQKIICSVLTLFLLKLHTVL